MIPKKLIQLNYKDGEQEGFLVTPPNKNMKDETIANIIIKNAKKEVHHALIFDHKLNMTGIYYAKNI